MSANAFHEKAGGGLLHKVSDALSGCVGPVCAAEGVVDVDVAEGSELGGEFGVVLDFALEFFLELGIFLYHVAG